MKIFNTNAICMPEIHYMVNISDKLAQIKSMVDAGQYFTINRARQYGKTTTLRQLREYLKEEYLVISLDFQRLDAAKFQNGNIFSLAFGKYFLQTLKRASSYGTDQKFAEIIENFKDILDTANQDFSLYELFEALSSVCETSHLPVVLIIDETDSASNNQVFLDFLAQLRNCYIERDEIPAFQSVILSGVYDIKNLKLKFAKDGGHKMNSPWNIAADFLIDMSFSIQDIEGMLQEYEQDHKTGMDTRALAELIYDYTSGYPFLVSRICKLMDEYISGTERFPSKKSVWTHEGVTESVKLLLSEKNTLFESLIGKLEDYPELKKIIYAILFRGENIGYNPDDRVIDIALMFGFIKIKNEIVTIANRIFETRLYNYFLTTDEVIGDNIYQSALQDKNQFVQNGRLNMRMILEKFVIHFHDLYEDKGEKFYEEDGRRYFLLYLRPIINGTGNYYIESQTRNRERTDVIIDYLGEQFIVELKLWRGCAYHTRGEDQLLNYLDHYHLDVGYMLSFNFNKKKQIGVQEIQIGSRVLVEAVV